MMQRLSTLLQQSPHKAYKSAFSLANCRTFHYSPVPRANRAFGFKQTGNPAEVITSFTFPDLKQPSPGTLNIELILAPIHPADINVIEGVYPVRPTATQDLNQHGLASAEDPVKLAGNEGVARVTGVGENVSGFKEGDLVVFSKQQSGTWISAYGRKLRW
jgi:NADPH:quinone reductase-like Zn-dependent oxidoreductase